MSTDLILTGTLKLAATDVSAEVTGLIIKGTVADVVVPATLSAGISHAGGAQKYELQIDYLSDDSATTTLFGILWTAIASASKEITYSGRLHPGVIGVGNPQYDGSIVVSAADLGGAVEGLSSSSLTCTATGAPVVTTA